MKIFFSFFMIMFFIHSIPLNGQQIIKSDNGNYLFNGSKFKLKELGPIFIYNPLAKEQFEEGIASLKRGKSSLILSLGTMGASMFIMYKGLTYPGNSPNYKQFGIGIILLGGSVILGGISIYQYSHGKGHIRNAIDLYNNKISMNLEPKEFDLRFSLHSSGIGVNYTF